MHEKRCKDAKHSKECVYRKRNLLCNPLSISFSLSLLFPWLIIDEAFPLFLLKEYLSNISGENESFVEWVYSFLFKCSPSFLPSLEVHFHTKTIFVASSLFCVLFLWVFRIIVWCSRACSKESIEKLLQNKFNFNGTLCLFWKTFALRETLGSEYCFQNFNIRMDHHGFLLFHHQRWKSRIVFVDHSVEYCSF